MKKIQNVLGLLSLFLAAQSASAGLNMIEQNVAIDPQGGLVSVEFVWENTSCEVESAVLIGPERKVKYLSKLENSREWLKPGEQGTRFFLWDAFGVRGAKEIGVSAKTLIMNKMRVQVDAECHMIGDIRDDSVPHIRARLYQGGQPIPGGEIDLSKALQESYQTEFPGYALGEFHITL